MVTCQILQFYRTILNQNDLGGRENSAKFGIQFHKNINKSVHMYK